MEAAILFGGFYGILMLGGVFGFFFFRHIDKKAEQEEAEDESQPIPTPPPHI